MKNSTTTLLVSHVCPWSATSQAGYEPLPMNHGDAVHSYYLPLDYWPSSVSLRNITIFTPTTQPHPARNPNYQGSRCLTLTSGQPMYPNIGAKIKCGIAV